jgi:hypothetical protein
MPSRGYAFINKVAVYQSKDYQPSRIRAMFTPPAKVAAANTGHAPEDDDIVAMVMAVMAAW